MLKKYANRWIKALESGKYKQTRGKLKGPRGYCCLGVLCDIVKKDLNVDWDDTHFLSHSGVLPPKVLKLTGMRDSAGVYRDKENAAYKLTLLDLNDDAKYSFKKIAAVIRKHWKKL